MRRRHDLVIALALILPSFVFPQVFKLAAPIASKPALLSSVGQSADIEMVKVLLDRAKLEYRADGQVKAGGLAASGARSLVIAIGGSSKGLGAAGISPEAELERAKALLAEARRLGMRIIGIHVGGEARRGELSDRFIQAALPYCDYVIVVAEGNKDGLFTRLCAAAKIPLDTVEKITKAGEPLARAFK
jgi:hypothetical protein